MRHPPKSSKPPRQSRRQFLQQVGRLGGSSAVYQAMLTMGLLVPGDKLAAANREQWRSTARQAQSGPLPTVAVLGAGISSLVTAYELKLAGYPVFVVEARDRPGGRNHTVRAGSTIEETGSVQHCNFDAGDELYFNAGPARISQYHENLLHYCRELGVPLQPFINDNRNAYIHSATAFGGSPKRAREIIAAQRGSIAELLAKAINTGALNSDIDSSERAAVLGVLSRFGALDQNLRFTGTTRGGLAPGSGGLTPEVAAAELDWNDFRRHPDIPHVPNFVESYNQSATMMQPVGGMDRIAYAFADVLADDIFYGVEITAIRRSGTGVRIHGRAGDQEGWAEADYAIIGIPPTVLRNIPNDFSPGIQGAINAVQVANPTKIAFQSPRFWETEDHIYGGISWTDPDILQMWYPSSGFGQAQGIIVGSYLFGGSQASNFGNLAPSARIQRALTGGEKIHPIYRNQVHSGISVAWEKVPYTLGGWSTSTPSTLLQNPDGPFLFTGDHLTYLPGWQEGAVISAMNALAKLQELMGV